MSFIQEFVEQQLAKNLSCSIKQQVQTCHSAVEDLLINLESLRFGPKIQIILTKINRISIFLNAKQQLLRLIQSEQQQPLIQWLIQQKLQSSLLIELVRRQQNYVAQTLKKTIKDIFLDGQKLEDYLSDNEMIRNCLSILAVIKEEINSNKTPSRQKLMSIDNIQGMIAAKIAAFQQKIRIFNQQIAKFIEDLYQFQNQISQQFKLFFTKSVYKKSPLKSRVEVISNADQIYEQNIVLLPMNKTIGYQFARTAGQMPRFAVQYRKQPLYQTSFVRKDNYASKPKSKEQFSQLGLNSQIKINYSAQKDQRHSKSQFGQAKTFLR